jgi:CCR4-NOT transcription complex subunit 7/8
VLTDCALPEEEEEFFAMIKLYFHNIYDVKYLMKSCKNLKGGLQEVAEQLEVGFYTYYLAMFIFMIVWGFK